MQGFGFGILDLGSSAEGFRHGGHNRTESRSWRLGLRHQPHALRIIQEFDVCRYAGRIQGFGVKPSIDGSSTSPPLTYASGSMKLDPSKFTPQFEGGSAPAYS